MVEMVEILDGRLGKRSVERVRYVINNLLHFGHCEIWSHFTCTVLCITTRLQLVTTLSLLMKYLVIFHANPCNKSYIYNKDSLNNAHLSTWMCLFLRDVSAKEILITDTMFY